MESVVKIGKGGFGKLGRDSLRDDEKGSFGEIIGESFEESFKTIDYFPFDLRSKEEESFATEGIV
jgi:hypothetical protein